MGLKSKSLPSTSPLSLPSFYIMMKCLEGNEVARFEMDSMLIKT